MTDETIAGADSGNQYGDYNSLSGYAGTFFPSWTDRRNGAQGRDLDRARHRALNFRGSLVSSRRLRAPRFYLGGPSSGGGNRSKRS